MLLCAATLAGCAAKTERPFVAPSDRTITGQLDATYDGHGAHVVLQNLSSEPVVITSVTLSACENIRNRCETSRMRVPLGPGQRHRLVTVTAASRNRGHSFRYSWSWEGGSSPTDPER